MKPPRKHLFVEIDSVEVQYGTQYTVTFKSRDGGKLVEVMPTEGEIAKTIRTLQHHYQLQSSKKANVTA